MSKKVIAALFMIAPNWKHLEGPSPAAQISKLWHTYIMGNCIAMKRNDYCTGSSQMKLTNMMLSKRTQDDCIQYDSLYIKLNASNNETSLDRNVYIGGKYDEKQGSSYLKSHNSS